jgi:hypothetical protein
MCSRRAIASRPWSEHVRRQDEQADFGRLCRLCFGSAGGWHRDWLPGLALGIWAVKVELLAETAGRKPRRKNRIYRPRTAGGLALKDLKTFVKS